MKRFASIALLAAAIGVVVLPLSNHMTIYAGSGAAQPAYSAALQTEQAPTRSATPSPGAAVYASHCAACHGPQRAGMPPTIPSLIGVGQRLSNEQITTIVHNGRGRMPAVASLPQDQLASLLVFLRGTDSATTQTAPATAAASSTTSSAASSAAGSAAGVHSSALAEAGGSLFQQNCAFCHGRDAMGGETGPDLTRSKLVQADVDGDKISEVVHNGRPEKKMPAFNFSSQEMASIVAFIHSQEAKARSMAGKRRGVDVADLQTGNVEAGKQYFNGAGGCAKCHSATGDLAGIAKRYEGLQLEERMLYPRDVKSRVTVTLPSGEKVTGTVAYRDEFTIGLRDSTGTYRSWPTSKVKYTVDSPVDAHVELFSKYTDDDIHNLMAYLQTMH